MFENNYLMSNKQPFLLIFPCSHLGDCCLKGKWPQMSLKVPPAHNPVDRAANLLTLPSWLEMIGLGWVADRSFSHQRAVLEQNSDEDPWIKAGGSKRSEPGCVCLGLPNSMQGIMSPLISVNVTSHQTEGGEWEKCNCITNLTLPPR